MTDRRNRARSVNLQPRKQLSPTNCGCRRLERAERDSADRSTLGDQAGSIKSYDQGLAKRFAFVLLDESP
jgi:hypothetical protein